MNAVSRRKHAALRNNTRLNVSNVSPLFIIKHTMKTMSTTCSHRSNFCQYTKIAAHTQELLQKTKTKPAKYKLVC